MLSVEPIRVPTGKDGDSTISPKRVLLTMLPHLSAITMQINHHCLGRHPASTGSWVANRHTLTMSSVELRLYNLMHI